MKVEATKARGASTLAGGGWPKARLGGRYHVADGEPDVGIDTRRA